MNYLLSVSLVFYLVSLAFHSYYLLFMISTLHLLWFYTGCQGHIFGYFQAFDKLWHERLLHKLETYGVKEEVLNLLRNYLHERYQRVALNDRPLLGC